MINPVFSARCPHKWLANGRRCYTVRRSGLTWREAQRSCRNLAAGSHLADLKTLEELLFVSSHMRGQNNLLLLWTGLNDQQVGKARVQGPCLELVNVGSDIRLNL